MAYLSMPSPDVYVQAVRSGLAWTFTVDAYYNGTAVAGATGLQPTGGTISDTTKPGVRRQLNLELAPSAGLFDALSPIGTQLKVTAHARYTDRTTVDIPMGVFDIDSQSVSEGGGKITVTAPDLWVRVQRAKFIQPQQSTSGIQVTDQVGTLVKNAIPWSITVTNRASSRALVGVQTWKDSREQAIHDLLTSIGAWAYFDRVGNFVIEDVPAAGRGNGWLLDSSATGVLTSLDRTRSRANTYNVVVVASSAASGEQFTPVVVWDNVPSSPTYAGPDPVNEPTASGPFGVVPYNYSTPLSIDQGQARAAGETILARTSGLASQVSLGVVPNYAIDAFDAINVVPPSGQWVQVVTGSGSSRRITRTGAGQILEQHVADTVTHSLTPSSQGSQGQQIAGRSTRTDFL